MPITGSKKKELHSSQQLPSDVWQRIASHLSTQEWAKIRHMCRAMQDVQPKQIDMAISGPSASSWLQRHWGSAVTLKLAWTHTSAVSWVLAHDVPPLIALEHLQVDFQEKGSHASAMFLAWLMCQPTGLRLLSIKAPAVRVVPLLRKLRHLILSADAFEDAAIAAISQLHGLQTLKLASKDTPINSHTIQCADLALGNMTSLTDVAIKHVCPAAIDLPSHCKLHVFGRPEDVTWDWWAAAARAGHLATMFFHFQKPHSGASVPHAFLASTGCTTLFWVNYCGNCDVFDAPAAFAAPAFAALSALYIDANEVELFIPGSLQLRTLHIAAETLTMCFGDLEALAVSLEEFSVVYIFSRGVVKMALALQRVGKAVEEVGAPMEEGYEGICTRQDLVYCRADPWPCTCGACLRCLGKKQVNS